MHFPLFWLQALNTEAAAARVACRDWIALSSRSISARRRAMRSASSGSERSSRIWPISWLACFLGFAPNTASSSNAAMASGRRDEAAAQHARAGVEGFVKDAGLARRNAAFRLDELDPRARVLGGGF